MTTSNSDIFKLLQEGQRAIRNDLRALQNKVDKGFQRQNGRLDEHDKSLIELKAARATKDRLIDGTLGAAGGVLLSLLISLQSCVAGLPMTPQPLLPTPTAEEAPPADTPTEVATEIVTESVTMTLSPMPTLTPTATEEPTFTPTPSPFPTPTPLPHFTFGILTPWVTPLGDEGLCPEGPIKERGTLICMLNIPGYASGLYQCVRPNHYTGSDVSCPSVLYSGDKVEVTERWERCDDEGDGGIIERWWFIPERGWVAEFINLDRFSCVNAVKVQTCPEG